MGTPRKLNTTPQAELQHTSVLTGGMPCSVFGWTRANEIGNGRWVMMGFAIGLLTEYATGADFPQQLILMLSYLGITDTD